MTTFSEALAAYRICAKAEGKYAEQLNLPDETIAVVNQLSYDTNAIALLDEIDYLPEEVQINEQFLNYLQQIAADKQVTDDELARCGDFDQDGLSNSDELQYGTHLFNTDSDDDGLEDPVELENHLDPLKPNLNVKYAIDRGLLAYIDRIKVLDEDGIMDENDKAAIDLASEIVKAEISQEAIEANLDYLLSHKTDFGTAYNSLQAVSARALNEYLEFGIDDDVIKYITLVSSLPGDFAKHALENKLCIQDRNLTKLEIKFLNQPDKYGQDLFDYYISEVNEINPELANELTKLPDLQELDIRNIEVLEDMVDLAEGESVFGTSFDSILNEGIKEARKYCSPLEALVWLLYDYDKEYIRNEISYQIDEAYLTARVSGAPKTQMKPLLWRLVYFSWEKGSVSDNFQSDRWKDFQEAIDRLNSPMLVSIYMIHNISYDRAKCQAFIKSGRDIWQSPKMTFNRKLGICKDQATFALHCLLENGYKYDNFELYQDDAACVLFACARPWSPGKGHLVCLFVSGGAYYTIDNGRLKGPFLRLDEAADATYSGWGDYYFINLAHTKTKHFRR